MKLKSVLNIAPAMSKIPGMIADDSGETLNIFLFGEIGGWWGMNKKEMLAKLKGRKYGQVNCVISSPGGDLAEALVIRDLLRSYQAPVTCYLTGICASAATVVADGADEVVMSRQCLYMIHKPLFSYTGGNADQLRSDADMLDQWEDIAVGIYRAKTGLSEEILRGMMRAETWMSADTAAGYGFVDRVEETLDIDFDIDGSDNASYRWFEDEIWFKTDEKTIFNTAVSQAIQQGYKQHFVEKQAAATQISNDMKFLDKIITMLVSAGIISEAQKEQAVQCVSTVEMPDVEAEVKKAMNAFRPKMEMADIIAAIAAATDEEKKEIQEAIGIQNGNETIEATVKDLAEKVAQLSVGGTATPQGNGKIGIESKNPEPTAKNVKSKYAAQMYLSAYNAGTIDAATFEKLTGEKAPKRN